MRKKLFGFVFALLVAIFILPANIARADEVSSDGQWMYTGYGSYCHITKYLGNAENVTVPATIDGNNMYYIDSNCFDGNYTVKSITLEKPVINWLIDSNAFYNCLNLKEIRLYGTDYYFDSDFASYCADNLVIKCFTDNLRWSDLHNWGYTVESLDPSITLSKSSLKLAAGTTTTLTAKQVNCNETVYWSSDNPSVATVNNGKITAKKVGTATISARVTVDGEVVISHCTVTVTKPIQISKSKTTLRIGKKVTLKATVPAGKKVTWKSSKKDVATVSSKGTVTGKKPGKTNVTASIKISGKTYSATCKVTVAKPSVRISRTYVSLNVGKTAKLKASVANASGKIRWKSNSKKIATVAPNGIVTARNVGSTKIVAYTVIGGKTYSRSCTIQVNKPYLNTSRVSSLYVGDSYRLHIYNRGKASVKFKSMDSKIATVNAKGTITARKKGSTLILVTVGKVKLKCKVSVANPYLSTTQTNVTAGFSTNLYVWGSSNQKGLKWGSSNKNVATVDRNGKVTAKRAGKCVITARLHGVALKCKVTVNKNAWTLNKYNRTDLSSVSYNNALVELRKAYFSGDYLYLQYAFLNKESTSFKKLNYINVSFYSDGSEIFYKEIYKVKKSFPSYKGTAFTIKIKAKNLKHVLDLQNGYWSLTTTTWPDGDDVYADTYTSYMYSYRKDFY